MNQHRTKTTNNSSLITLRSSLLLMGLLSGCAVLPPVTKVHPGNINSKGVYFMLPKPEMYVGFQKYKTDSVKGMLSGFPEMVSELNVIYFPETVRHPVRNTCISYRYTDFSFTEKFEQDTNELYYVNINKNKKHIFTNLDFCLALSDEGMIEATDMTASNQTVAVAANIAGFAVNSILPQIPFGSASRGTNGDTEIASDLLDTLRAIKRNERRINANPKYHEGDLATSQYILGKLAEREDTILNVLLGTSTTAIIDSFEIPLNSLGKDTIYIIDNVKYGKHIYTTVTGSKGQFGDYLFKIQPVWLTTFTNTEQDPDTKGLPYKMPEHLKYNVYSPRNELITYADIIVPSKSTFYLPDRLGASKSQLKVDYNPNGTIRIFNSGYQSAGPEETRSILENYNPSAIIPAAPSK